jgi:hypothetical protein
VVPAPRSPRLTRWHRSPRGHGDPSDVQVPRDLMAMDICLTSLGLAARAARSGSSCGGSRPAELGGTSMAAAPQVWPASFGWIGRRMAGAEFRYGGPEDRQGGGAGERGCGQVQADPGQRAPADPAGGLARVWLSCWRSAAALVAGHNPPWASGSMHCRHGCWAASIASFGVVSADPRSACMTPPCYASPSSG